MGPAADSAVVLITGASRGIGAACSRHLARLGYRVYGGSRSYARKALPADEKPPGGDFHRLPLDVTQTDSAASFVQDILDREGRIDALVNNAGFGIAGAAEDTSIDEFTAQFETNFFGAVRMCQEVLPVMREQGRGIVLNISSLAGKVAVPFQSAYSSSKFALEGFSDALRLEVRPFGIDVVVVEPGDLATGFTDNRQYSAASGRSSPYHERFSRALGIMEQDERDGPAPEIVAALIERILRARNPRPRYQVGPWFERAAIMARRLLPERVFEAGLARYYRVHS